MTSTVSEKTAAPRSRRLKGVLKRATIIVIVAACLPFAFAWARDWWLIGRFTENTDDAYVGGDVTAIAPHVAGFVKSIDVHDNQRVAVGDILLRLDDRDMRTAFDHAEAVERERRATLAGLLARRRLQDTVIAAAAADLDAKVAQSSFALQDANRYESLANTTAVTRQETERAISLGRSANAVVASAKASLEGAKLQVGVLDAQIAAATAEVAQAVADVRAAALNLSYTELRSPIEGYVGNRAARVGMYASVGSYMLSVVPAHGLWVDANFKEDQLTHMRLGDPASLVADVMPDVVLHGRVASLAPGTGAVFSVIPPENATGNFTKIVQRVPVRIKLDESDREAISRLRPGLSTTVRVDTRRPE